MTKYLFKRLLQLIPLLIGISLISFFVIHLAPGDPTNLFTTPNVKPEELARIRANFGLDKPVIIQYFYWLVNILKGNFGTDLLTGRPVVIEILERLPATLLLTGSAYILTFLLAIPLGVLSAVKKNSWFDKSVTLFSFAGMATPSFWLALILMLVFAVKLDWLPAVGMYTFTLKDSPWFIRAWDVCLHLILPVTTMTLVSLAGLTRYQRAAMLEILNKDYIRTARAKGLPERVVIFKHALRNALIPIVTIFGLSLPDIFGGAFIIETVFGWPGMGRLGVQAVFQRNYPLIMGIVMFSAFLIIIGNLLADLLYAWVDPRIRLGEKKQ
ncbi:MAG: ABC transporter permease [Candidatus Saganbacteria bacterium]|nr:ABC transporter permease [Candidatus Saganbacteria bacterium]